MNAAKVIVEMQRAAPESTADSVREWFIAVGTVGATIVALYVAVFRERWRRPKLSLEYGGPTSSDAVIVGPNPDYLPQPVAYVRLRVVAARRRRAAEDVEVMILSARELAPRQTFPARAEPSIQIDGQLLRWSNSTPTVIRLTIPPGTHRHLDLVRVDKSLAAAGEAPAQIEVAAIPVDGRHRIKSGRFELELAVAARNADARRYVVVVSYDGGWGDDVWQHLSVQVPRLVR